MNVMDKLMTAVRSGARELGEAVVDSQSLRIFEQEIHDSKENLEEAKKGLTEIIAKKMAAERQLASLSSKIAEYEDYATKALGQSNEALALEISGKIAELEADQADVIAEITLFEQSTKRLKLQIKNAEKIIADHERQLAIVQTQDSVNLASQSAAETVTMNDSAISSAKESLERIKQKQQFVQDRLQADVELKKELSGEQAEKSLDTKLKESGIKPDDNAAQSVLDRIKEKNKNKTTKPDQ